MSQPELYWDDFCHLECLGKGQMRMISMDNVPFTHLRERGPFRRAVAITRGALHVPTFFWPLLSTSIHTHGSDQTHYRLLRGRVQCAPRYDGCGAVKWATVTRARTIHHVKGKPVTFLLPEGKRNMSHPESSG